LAKSTGCPGKKKRSRYDPDKDVGTQSLRKKKKQRKITRATPRRARSCTGGFGEEGESKEGPNTSSRAESYHGRSISGEVEGTIAKQLDHWNGQGDHTVTCRQYGKGQTQMRNTCDKSTGKNVTKDKGQAIPPGQETRYEKKRGQVLPESEEKTAIPASPEREESPRSAGTIHKSYERKHQNPQAYPRSLCASGLITVEKPKYWNLTQQITPRS